MHEIICPNCKKAFKVDEAGYAEIVKQVHNREFEQQLNERLESAKNKVKKDMNEQIVAKNTEINDLKAKIEANEVNQKLAITEAVGTVKSDMKEEIVAKSMEINDLKAKIEATEVNQKLAITKAVDPVEKERVRLANELDKAEFKRQTSEQSIKYGYEIQIRDNDDKHKTEIQDLGNELRRCRDKEVRMSTKMLGEALEQHCENEFNDIRVAAFPNAYFEKDNDASSGSKGDYIFRDFDEAGTEIVSIMFEMKNESDTTATKKKNKDFFKRLDKDRTEKKCEYAILVSMLEPESDFYNSGIAVTHLYPKMFVVRPQCFIQIIILLRNASMKSLEYKTELAFFKAQNIDITNFENDLEDYKNLFNKDINIASNAFKEAIKKIESSIDQMQKTKDALEKTDRNFCRANDKLQKLTIKKLTRKNPTMKSMFNELKDQEEIQILNKS